MDTDGNPCLVLDAEALVEHGLAAVDRLRAGPTSPPRDSPPILVVDDSVTSRTLEQSILESAGYTVEVATNGREALDKAHRNRYGLFLVDVEMPVMDGYTFVERTRADASLRHVPVIMLTSRGSPEDRIRGEHAGANAYLDKNEFDQHQLLACIRNLVT
jgi:two-component system chemotaxis sensor kinase CheA